MGAGIGIDCCSQRERPADVKNDKKPSRAQQAKQQKGKKIEDTRAVIPIAITPVDTDNPQEARDSKLSFTDCTPRSNGGLTPKGECDKRDRRSSYIPDGTCGNCQKKVSLGIRYCSLACKEDFHRKQNEQATRESTAEAKAAAAKRKAQTEADRKAKAEAERKAKAEAEQKAKEETQKKVAFRKSRTEAAPRAECLICQKPLRTALTKYCSMDCKEKGQAAEENQAKPSRGKSFT
jgi:hypothetical protein